ncbi:uncharacterized protein LOC144145171 [Haemaphysalis longicornis]
MASALFICLVFAATITIGVQQNFCVENNLNDGPLAYQNCTLACDGAEPAIMANTTAANGTPCMYTSEGGNDISDSIRREGTQMGICKNKTCSSTINPTTQGANANKSGATTLPAGSHNATTMPSNETVMNGSSQATSEAMPHSTGRTVPANMTPSNGWSTPIPSVSMKVTNGTTVHANQTTTKKPSSAASPSRLLGSANQGAIITVLALAVLGRFP